MKKSTDFKNEPEHPQGAATIEYVVLILVVLVAMYVSIAILVELIGLGLQNASHELAATLDPHREDSSDHQSKVRAPQNPTAPARRQVALGQIIGGVIITVTAALLIFYIWNMSKRRHD